MKIKPRHSIRGKLTGIIMLTSTTAVLLACFGFVASGLYNFRNRLLGDLSAISHLVAFNSTDSLESGDAMDARDILQGLRAKPSIVAAAIFTKRGDVFARYEPHRSVQIPRTIRPDGIYDRGDLLETFSPIRRNGRRIGTLYVAADQSDR